LPHRPAAEPANPHPSRFLEERMSGKLTPISPSSRPEFVGNAGIVGVASTALSPGAVT
jgi:hypothetical protein